ncbi:hypothetical protein Taro_053930, partial [Colocasia esculenta]|nr:hypothetical protein [Colocasia esculenta]
GIDPKWIISGQSFGRRKGNPDPCSEEKRAETWAVPQSPPSTGSKGRVFVPLPDRRQRRPSSFRSSTTTAIPSRSVTTAAILLPICDDSGYPPSDLRRQRPSTTEAIPSRSAMMAAIFFRLATAAASPPPGADVLITASYQNFQICYIFQIFYISYSP